MTSGDNVKRYFTIAKFTPKDLNKIHRAHRDYILSSARAYNQIMFSKIYHIFEQTPLSRVNPEWHFVLVRQSALFYICISSLIEFHNLNNNYISSIVKIFPNDAKKIGTSYKPISQQISKAKWLVKLRNKTAFHFEMGHHSNLLNSIHEDQDLFFVFGNGAGEVAHSYIEEIIFGNITNELGNGDLQRGIMVAWEFLNQTSNLITQWHNQVCQELFERHGILKNSHQMVADSKSYGEVGAQHVPLFIKK